MPEQTTRSSSNGHARLGEHGRALGEEARAMADALNGAVNEAADTLRTHVREQPYLVLGIAAGVGYILGGGLPPRLTMFVAATAGRALLNNFLGSIVQGVQTPTE